MKHVSVTYESHTRVLQTPGCYTSVQTQGCNTQDADTRLSPAVEQFQLNLCDVQTPLSAHRRFGIPADAKFYFDQLSDDTESDEEHSLHSNAAAVETVFASAPNVDIGGAASSAA